MFNNLYLVFINPFVKFTKFNSIPKTYKYIYIYVRLYLHRMKTLK